MKQFGSLYSQYYDLLYAEKKYQRETEYVIDLMIKHANTTSTILDLGCGTGVHAEILCDHGYKVHGVDLSEDMLEIAETRRNGKEDNLSFSKADIRKLDLERKFDTVISLFHVMSYQNSNIAVDEVFQGVNEHLNDEGLFIFDFWYGPAVLTDLPKTTVKRLENESLRVTRIGESRLHAQSNTVDVEFDIFVTQKEDDRLMVQKELHTMRYFFDTELEMLCDKHQFKIEAKHQWLDTKQPGFDSWNVVWVLKK